MKMGGKTVHLKLTSINQVLNSSQPFLLKTSLWNNAPGGTDVLGHAFGFLLIWKAELCSLKSCPIISHTRAPPTYFQHPPPPHCPFLLWYGCSRWLQCCSPANLDADSTFTNSSNKMPLRAGSKSVFSGRELHCLHCLQHLMQVKLSNKLPHTGKHVHCNKHGDFCDLCCFHSACYMLDHRSPVQILDSTLAQGLHNCRHNWQKF